MALKVVKDFLGRTTIAQDTGYEQPVEGLPQVIGLATGTSHASPKMMRDVVTFQADSLCPPADITHEIPEWILSEISAALHPRLEAGVLVARRVSVERF
jgi:hypothetical protein